MTEGEENEMEWWEVPYGPSRFFWWREVDAPWWKWIILEGIHGGDEWCNRTIGFRIGRGCLFVVLNIPMRRKICDTCLKECGPDQ